MHLSHEWFQAQRVLLDRKYTSSSSADLKSNTPSTGGEAEEGLLGPSSTSAKLDKLSTPSTSSLHRLLNAGFGWVKPILGCSTIFKVKACTSTGQAPVWHDLDSSAIKWFQDRGIPTNSSSNEEKDRRSSVMSLGGLSSGQQGVASGTFATFGEPLDARDVELEDFGGLVVPAADGFLNETPNDAVRRVLSHFVLRKKPICLISTGTASLLSTSPPLASPPTPWLLEGYALTSPSNIDALKK
ncbi:hypothetical protein HDV05_000297, partial [Chytridiales sp. JEL 0842]